MNKSYDLGLSALLESDLSSYEYFNSLPADVKRKIEALDLGSFEEMQRFAGGEARRSHTEQS